MSEIYAAVKRRGKSAWIVGAVTTSLDFPTADVDKDGITNISLQESVDVAHSKNSDGGDALTVMFNRQLSGNITLVYVPGKCPRPGDIVVYTDPDDGSKQKALEITQVGKETSNSMSANTMPVTLIWREAWGDDASVIASATTE